MSVVRSWKFWVGLLISAACIVFAFWGIDWRAFASTFGQISWLRFCVATLWVVFVLWVRAYRWKFLVGHLKRINTYRLFQATTIGFAVNNLLPARIGELVRSYALSRAEGLKFSGTFATVVAERIYDTMSFAFLLVLFLASFDVPALDRLGISQEKLTVGIALLFVFGLALMLLLRTKAELVESVVRRVFGIFSRKLADRLAAEVRHFSEGISHDLGAREVVSLVWTSLFLWVVSVFQFWLAANSLGVDLGMKHSFLLMVAVLFGISIPASPGYVGTYHLVAMKVLQAMGYSAEIALPIAIVVHITNYITQTALGLWNLKSIGFRLKEVTEEVASRAAEAPVGGEDSAGV